MERESGNREQGFIEETRHAIGQKAIDFLVKTYAKDFEQKGWEAIPESMLAYLKSLNVTPVYAKETTSQFGELRQKLDTESGLIISNHPVGFVDVPIILSNIHREDFKAYVQNAVFEGIVSAFERNFGQTGKQIAMDKLIPNDPTKARENFKLALEHISDGGILLLHPTAGQDRHSTEQIEFQSGFRLFLKQLSPEQMVYSFCVNPFDLKKNFGSSLATSSKFAGLSSEELVHKNFNPNRLTSPAVINVDENYGTVAQWREHAQSNAIATSHYWDIFKDSSKK